MEKWKNIKEYIKSGVKENILRGDLICADVLVCILGVIGTLSGLFHSLTTEILSFVVFGLSIISILFGFFSTKNLNIKKYVRFYAVFSIFSTLIFTIVGYNFLIIKQNSYPELTCLIPLVIFAITVVKTNFQIKKNVDVKHINRKMELTASAVALGVLCSRVFLRGNASFANFMELNIGYVLIFLACVFATNSLNFVKWYYINQMEKQGIIIE